MSAENVGVVQRCLAGRGPGDYRAARALIHPDVEVDLTARPDGQVYRGQEEAAEAVRGWVAQWDDYSYEPQEFIDAGDDVVVLFRETGRGKESGVLTELLGATVWTLREGQVVRTKTYTDRKEALEAVGL